MVDPTWPNGKRVAVLVSVLLENWSPGKSPTYFPRTTPLKPGAVDHAAMQWSHYGGREGIWRILALLERRNVKATVFANALSAELYPDAIAAIVRAGHGLAGHGYAQDQYLCDLAPAEQQAVIRRSLDTLERVGGTRPQGWVCSVYSWNEATFDLLVREGVRWHADALDVSQPRLQQTPSGPIVALPWCDFVDNRVLRASPRDYFDVYKDSFDFLRASEPMGLLHLAVHSHFGGRPLIAAQLEKLLDTIAGSADAWLVRHDELVEWFLAQPQGALAARRPFTGPDGAPLS
jgi:peptidoglycan/xylan/chitin deacetylase (PgdA/CDA1 family)